MSTTTTITTTTTMASEVKRISGFDRTLRLLGVEQKLAPLEPNTNTTTTTTTNTLNTPATPVRAPRRLEPQLVETTRRSRRDGDSGLRPADRTDATPYTRHGYSDLWSRMRRRNARNLRTPARDTVRSGQGKGGAKKKACDAALDIFPNSRPRTGGAAHFYFLSDDDTASESQLSFGPGLDNEVRRRSTDMSWWQGPSSQDGIQSEGPAVPAVDARDVESEPECPVPRRTPADAKRRLTETHVQVSTSNVLLLAPKPRAPFREKPAAINTAAEKAVDPEFEVMRRAASPPLLGGDLVFPRCESPETCRLTTDVPFAQCALEARKRDPTQKCGLWGGYCFKVKEEAPSVVDANKLTPPGHAGLWPGRGSTGPQAHADVPSPPPTPRGMWAALRTPTPPSQGLNPFQNIPVPMEPPAEPAKTPLTPEEKERRVEAEFTDAFVTQVYNYLSLGYPVTARDFDDELSASSGISVEELRSQDEEVMRRGHVCDFEVEKCPAERQCPRWRALKEYVKGWARGQENLDVGRKWGAGVGVWGARGSWRP